MYAAIKPEAKVISKFAQEVSEKGFDTQAQQKFDEMQAFRQSEKQPERAKVDNEMER